MDNKFINAYIDVAVGTLHEYLGSILQLKANMKVMQDVISTHEKRIAELEDTTSVNDKTVIDLKKQLNEIITEANDLRNKASHVDTFAKNITQLKEQIKNRDEIINQLEEQLKKFDVEVQFEDDIIYELNQEPLSILPINKEKKKPTKKLDDDF